MHYFHFRRRLFRAYGNGVWKNSGLGAHRQHQLRLGQRGTASCQVKSLFNYAINECIPIFLARAKSKENSRLEIGNSSACFRFGLRNWTRFTIHLLANGPGGRQETFRLHFRSPDIWNLIFEEKNDQSHTCSFTSDEKKAKLKKCVGLIDTPFNLRTLMTNTLF